MKNSSEIPIGKMVEKDGTAAPWVQKVRSSPRAEPAACESDESECNNSEDEAMLNEIVNLEVEGSALLDEGCFFKPPKKGS